MYRSKTMLMLIVVILVFSLAGTALAARPLKMYAAYPEDSILTIGYYKAADEIREKTDGRVNIKIFPGAQLGSYEDVIEEIRQGTIELGATWLTKRYDERLDILNLPGFGALGYQQLEKICYNEDSPLPKYVADVLDSMKIVSLGAWPEPYATYAFIKGRRPANLTDFENKKTNIRVPHMPLYRDAALAMGYQTVTIDYSEIFNSMQTGQVDGTTGITLEVHYLVAKDIVKHIDYNRLHGNPCWLLINQDVWQSFSDDDRKIVMETFAKWSKDTLAQLEKLDEDYKVKLEEAGIEVYMHSDENYIEMARHMRNEIWPRYYNVFGEQFLKDFDSYVTQMEQE